MPNLQGWLNAWVKVNTKQSATNPPSASINNGHSQSSRTHHGKPHPNRASTRKLTTTTNSSGASERGYSSELRDALPVLLEQAQISDSNFSNEEPTIATSTQPNGGANNPEHAAIRKFNHRKHKRRLNRTNSFSDLLREKAKYRSSRSSGGSSIKHVSVERRNYAGPGDRVEDRRRLSHHYHPDHHQGLRQPPRSLPPPPTLHHPFIEPDPSPDGVSSNDSSPSISPSETALTVPRSNTNQDASTGDYYDTNASHHSSVDHSSSALFGVAEFFGTDLNDLRPPTASAYSRHQTHAAQHGLEDEQPQYLRSHLQKNNHLFQGNSPQSSSSSLHPENPHTNPFTSATRLKHSQIHRHGISPNTIQQQPHHYTGRKYPPLPPYRRGTEATSSTGTARKTTPTAAPKKAPQPADAGHVLGGVRLPFFGRPTAATATPTGEKADSSDNKDNISSHRAPPFGVGEANCKGCQLAQAELEYMRSMAIRKEYTCDKCGKSNDSSSNITSKTPTVKNSSQQTSEVTARHKKQVEQLMKERNRWQRNMHLKLEKLANLSRNLNSESSVRVEESQSLKAELEQVMAERDQMAGELAQLKTTFEVYEKERQEHSLAQDKMTTYENEGMHQAEKAIAARDGMIAKLSARLATTLDTLALEREQQRQRRQIIFPPTSSTGRNGYNQINGHASNAPHLMRNNSANQLTNQNTTPADGDSENHHELLRLRAQLLESQRQLEVSRLEAKQRENGLLLRCETLEKQLEGTSSKSHEKKIAPKEHHHLSDKNGWGLS